VTIAVFTGGRDRIPTLAELVVGLGHLRQRRATIVRHGDYGLTDKSVAAWLKARAPDLIIEPWRASDYGEWPWCGPKRNRAMLEGDGGPDLFGMFERPRADFLVAFEGGEGTADCTRAARVERGIPVEPVAPVLEPRIWNKHHGTPPGPGFDVARPKLLGNPDPLELRDGESRHEAAAEALERYKIWLWRKIKPGSRWYDQRFVDELKRIRPEHYLLCTCWPLDCHAEIILAAWRGLHGLLGPEVARSMTMS
jgi:hypothetical protein